MKWKDFVASLEVIPAQAGILSEQSSDSRLRGNDATESATDTHLNGWTPDRRAKQREAIRTWRPWAKSTGPRSVAGKLRSAMNAKTHGRRSAPFRRFDSLLRFHRQWLKLVRENRRSNIWTANELLEILRRGVANTSLYGKKDFILPNPAWLMVYSGLKEP